MNLTILAASGRTGLALTRQALERGHTVTAIARDPRRISLPDSDGLRQVAADVTDPASIAEVIGADSVVLSALGTEQAGILFAGAKAVVAAGPRRVIWLGAYGTGASAEAAGEAAGVLGTLLGDRLGDKVEADDTVLAAGGTVFHAGLLGDGPESPDRRTVGLDAAPRSTSARRSAGRPSPPPCSTRPRRPASRARSPCRWPSSAREAFGLGRSAGQDAGRTAPNAQQRQSE